MSVKYRRSLYFIWILIAALAFSIIYYIVVGYPWSDIQAFRFWMILFVFLVNLLIDFFFLRKDIGEDSTLSSLGIVFVLQILYVLFSVGALIVFAILDNDKLSTQISVQIVIHVFLLLGIIFIIQTRSHTTAVNASEQYNNDIRELREHFRIQSVKCANSEMSEEDKKRFTTLCGEFCYIAPCKKKEAREKEMKISALINEIGNSNGLGVSKCLDELEELIKLRKLDRS